MLIGWCELVPFVSYLCLVRLSPTCSPNLHVVQYTPLVKREQAFRSLKRAWWREVRPRRARLRLPSNFEVVCGSCLKFELEGEEDCYRSRHQYLICSSNARSPTVHSYHMIAVASSLSTLSGTLPLLSHFAAFLIYLAFPLDQKNSFADVEQESSKA